jgi:AraC family transcriptional regulator
MDIFAKTSPTKSEIFHNLRGLIAEARRSIQSNHVGAERCLDSAVLMLTALSVQPPEPQGDLVAGGLAPWQITRLKALMETRLDQRLTTGDLAAAVHLSKSHLARAFHRSIGDPPHLYLMKRRIARAKELMMTTQDSLAIIALACGLSDQAHLSRVFRRLEGDSPNAWRRRSMLPSTRLGKTRTIGDQPGRPVTNRTIRGSNLAAG